MAETQSDETAEAGASPEASPEVPSTPAPGALRRKAGAGRPRPAHPIPGPSKGMRLAIARAGRDIPGLDLAVSAIADDRRSLAEVLELLPERALLAVLEGPREGLGLVALSPELFSGVVEVLTMGQLAADTRPARKPTRTDAAMTAGLIDRVMTELEGEFAESCDLVWAGGFRYASFLDDPRPLELLLDDIPYRVFSAEVGLVSGARQGRILTVLPAEGRGPPPATLREPAQPPADTDAASAWSAAMGTAVCGVEAELRAVLHRLRLPLSAVLGLGPGDLIPVPAAQLEAITLEAIDGRRFGAGRLGQNRGMRAVRLTRLPQGYGVSSPEPESEATLAEQDILPEAAFPRPGTVPPMPMPPDLPAPGEEVEDAAAALPDLPMAPMAPLSLDDLPGTDLPGDGGDEGDDPGLPPLAVSG